MVFFCALEAWPWHEVGLIGTCAFALVEHLHDDGVVVKKGGDCSGFAANPLQKESIPGGKRLGDTNVCPNHLSGRIKSGLTTAQSRK